MSVVRLSWAATKGMLGARFEKEARQNHSLTSRRSKAAAQIDDGHQLRFVIVESHEAIEGGRDTLGKIALDIFDKLLLYLFHIVLEGLLPPVQRV